MPIRDNLRSPATQQLVLVSLAWMVPLLMAIDIALTVRLNPDGWLLVSTTPAGDALYGALLFGVFFNNSRSGGHSRRPVRVVVATGLAISGLLSLLSPLRLLSVFATLLLFNGMRIVDLRSKRALTISLTVMTGFVLAAVYVSAFLWTAGFDEDVVVPGPAQFDFVLHDGDAGATGGGTTGYARESIAGIAQVQLRLFDGDLGARPAVRWLDGRTVLIDGTEVDLWRGPYIGSDLQASAS